MLEIKNLSKSYGSCTVYKNFSLDISDGEITCILGESGSGKTTLLNCIARLTQFTGEITPVKCSYIFQEPRLVPNLTVYGNLALVTRDAEKIERALEAVHLTDKKSCYPKTLSGGQARRVAIACAFAFDGGAILMDEPFSSLDLRLKYEIINEFAAIRRENKKTVIFVTHDVDEAVALANRIIVIDGGKTVFDESNQPQIPVKMVGNAPIKQKLTDALMRVGNN